MNRSELLSGMFAQFEESAHTFCTDSNGLFCEIVNDYKGIEKVQNLKRKTARIYYKSFAIEFAYTSHGMMGVVNSILSCSVYPDKSENSIGIPLPLVTDYFGMDVEAPLCIPLITNEQAMLQAFRCVAEEVKRLLPVVAQKCSEAEQREELQQKFCDEMRNIFQIEISGLLPEPQRRALADFFVNRFSSDAFLNALRGNREKAVKQLGKSKSLTGYETRMHRIWQTQEDGVSAQLSVVLQNAKAFSGYGTSKVERREFTAAFVAWFVLCPLFSVLYLGLYAVLVWIAGRQSVCLLGPSYNYPYCFLAGFITAIAVSYFTRFFFFKRLFKKDYGQYCEMEYITNVDGSNKLMKCFLTVVVVGSVVLLVLMSHWNLNFLQDGLVDNTEFFSLKGEYYSYNEVACVYYKPNRVNGFGETIDYPSYVLVLENGYEIDLYEHGDLSDYSGELLDFLREKGIEIK